MNQVATAEILTVTPQVIAPTARAEMIAQESKQQATALISMIERVLLLPTFNFEALERLLDIQDRIFKTQQEQAFNAAMAAAQQKMPIVHKNCTNSHTTSTYANLAAVCEAAMPIYGAEGLSLTFGQGECPTAGWMRVTCEVRHSLGFVKHYHLDLPIDGAGTYGKANKNPTQAVGSTTSYGRRYLTCMIFNIATDDDDDGNNGKNLNLFNTGTTPDIDDNSAPAASAEPQSIETRIKNAKSMKDLTAIMSEMSAQVRKQYIPLYNQVRSKLSKGTQQ